MVALAHALWHNTFDMSRNILFFLAVLVGVGLGLLYGWVVSPVEFIDTTAGTLRLDYKADYVLMVAETFSQEQDPQQAAQRLALLGAQTPVDIVQGATTTAVQAGYTPSDLALMRELADALRTWSPVIEADSE